MQADRYSNPRITTLACVWCGDDYAPAVSRARDVQLFCRRRCEVEARYWLLDVLTAIGGDTRAK